MFTSDFMDFIKEDTPAKKFDSKNKNFNTSRKRNNIKTKSYNEFKSKIPKSKTKNELLQTNEKDYNLSQSQNLQKFNTNNYSLSDLEKNKLFQTFLLFQEFISKNNNNDLQGSFNGEQSLKKTTHQITKSNDLFPTKKYSFNKNSKEKNKSSIPLNEDNQKNNINVDSLKTELLKLRQEKSIISKIKTQYLDLNKKLHEDIQKFNKIKSDFELFRKNEIDKIKTIKKKYGDILVEISEIKKTNLKLQKRNEELENIIKRYEISKNKPKSNCNIRNENLIKSLNDLDKEKENDLKEKISENQNITISSNKNTNSSKKINKNSSFISNHSHTKNSESFSIKREKHTKLNLSFSNTELLHLDKSKKINVNALTIENDKNNKTEYSKTIPNKEPPLIKYNKIKVNSIINKRENDTQSTKYSFISKYKSNKKRININCINDNTLTTTLTNIHKNIENIINKSQKKDNSISNKTLCVTTTNINNNFNKIENSRSSSPGYKSPLEEFDFKIPKKYTNKDYSLLKTTTVNGKIVKIFNNDKKEVIFQSGVRKEIFKDGFQIVYFVNGDMKQNLPDGKSVYFFNESKTVQTTFKDGLQVFKFENGQIEKHFTDGTKQISFPDGSQRFILSDGYEETYYADGSVRKKDINGKIICENMNSEK